VLAPGVSVVPVVGLRLPKVSEAKNLAPECGLAAVQIRTGICDIDQVLWVRR